MCDECRLHGVDCTTLMLQRARREQIVRLLLDIYFPKDGE